MPHIASLLSGGVDSACALAKYIERNPQNKNHICAYYLKIWLEDELSFLGDCPWEEDIFYAKKTAQKLGIPLEIISLQQEYHEKVVAYTLDELKKGGTPSPDIFCNERIKFGAFLDKVNADLIISGHYAQLQKEFFDDGSQKKVQLHMATDKIKDQTYFLSHLHQSQLEKVIFPIGNMTKKEVRKFAEEHNLPPKDRKDSQGICFLGKIKYRDFITYHMGEKQGMIIDDSTQKVLGTHLGVWLYTIGQRNGLGLGGGPWYVCDKSIKDNIVWVRHINDIKKKFLVEIENVHWINDSFKTASDSEITIKKIKVKLRHGENMYDAKVAYNAKTNNAHITLEQGDIGIASGQIVVLYEDIQCLGCGRIRSGNE